jgi:hypothetical protein
MAVYDASGADVFGSQVDSIKSAWYARTVDVPADWAGRRVVLGFRWIPGAVLVYVDGRRAGEAFFPGGEVDLTSVLAPGRHEIAFFTSAKLPERLVQVFDAPDQARTVTKKELAHKGVNGDVFLAAEPAGVRLDDVTVAGRPAVIAHMKGSGDTRTLFMEQSSGAYLTIQVWDGLGWDNARIAEFAASVHVTDDAKPTFG